MPARATKRTEAAIAPAASVRRGGRPRTATASAKIYSDLRIELVSLQRRPGEADLGSRDCAVVRGEPDAGARSHPEIIG